MKLLITGANGFIGKNVKEYLEANNRGYDIYAPSRKELDCFDEQAVTRYLTRHKFDFVLHFAVCTDPAGKGKDAVKTLDYNLRIFLNFEKNSAYYGKMYYTGSGAEYDKRGDIINAAEDDAGKTIPADQYGLMKYTIGRIIESSVNIYNFRLFGVFGKYEYYPVKFISLACCKAILDIPLSMRQNVYFDYLWAGDFCRILEYFLWHEPRCHTYNIVSGKRVSLKEICGAVLAAAGKELPVFVCREGLANEYTASNARFLEECPGFTFTPLEQAVAELYEWYSQNKENIDPYKLFY